MKKEIINLLFTVQTVNHRMEQLKPSKFSSATKEAEIKLSEGFANLHAQLQATEEKLRLKVVTAVHSSYYNLAQLSGELENDIRALNGVLDVAKSLVNDVATPKRINIQMVIEKLKNAADLPCCLAGKQQIAGDVR